MNEIQNNRAMDFTANIVASYVNNNRLQPAEFLKLIGDVHTLVSGGLAGAVAKQVPEAEALEKPTPAQIRKSVSPDALISFEDGKSYKTLKRHLTTRGLTPQAYRAKWGLPADYPIVAPSYAAQRSALAKSIGLGRSGGRAADAPSQA